MPELSSLYIEIPGSVSNLPAGAPVKPDIDSDVLFDLRAEDFPDIQDGTKPLQLISERGEGDIRTRTFDENGSDNGGWAMPTQHQTGGPDGGPWWEFPGNSSMKNYDGSGVSVISGPQSFSFTYKLNLLAGHTFGIFGFVKPDTGTSGRLTIQARPTQLAFDNPPQSSGPAAPVSNAMAAGGWGTAVVSLNGANSFVMAGGVLSKVNLVAPNYRGFLVGRPTFGYDAGLPSFAGGLRALKMYTRALSEGEVRAEYLRQASRYELI